MFFMSMSSSSESTEAIAGSKFWNWIISGRLIGSMLAPCSLVTLVLTTFQIDSVLDMLAMSEAEMKEAEGPAAM